MRGGAVKLLVECPALVQHAVENIRRDLARRETRHFGGQGEPLRGHGAGTSRGIGQRFVFCAHAVERSVALTCEYAEYKNRVCDFTVRLRPLFSCSRESNAARMISLAENSQMTD